MKNHSKILTVSIAALAFAGATQLAQADFIPYGSPGSGTTVGLVNPSVYSFTVLASAPSMDIFFAGSSAGYTDILGVSVGGGPTIYGLNNHASALGQTLDIGPVIAGQSLVFYMDNGQGNIFSSIPSGNSDGLNHVYATPYSATGSPGLGGGIPAGLFIAFEDLLGGGDLDYNDITIVATNLTAGVPGGPSTVVPEPSTMVAGALMALPLGVSALRILRKRKTA